MLPCQSWTHSGWVFPKWAFTGQLLPASHELSMDPIGHYTVLLSYRILMNSGERRVCVFSYAFICELQTKKNIKTWTRESNLYGEKGVNGGLVALRANVNDMHYLH